MSHPEDVEHFSDAKTQKFVKAVVGIVSAVILLIPVIVFYILAIHKVSYGGRIGALSGFTIAFNAALLMMTNISKHELFGASAGYVDLLEYPRQLKADLVIITDRGNVDIALYS